MPCLALQDSSLEAQGFTRGDMELELFDDPKESEAGGKAAQKKSKPGGAAEGSE